MHPQLFLETFWQMEFRPQIFVAMSFDSKYDSRFKNIIVPAIECIDVGGNNLKAYRADLSKTGDSILTDIADGIAHSQMILADVSSIGKDVITGEPYRNGNVMYEVGLALACRQPSEILLIRDDHDKFLFDVSTIPHITIDFTDRNKAIGILQEALFARLNERQTINDARVKLAISTLSNNELRILKENAHLSDISDGSVFGFENNLATMEAIPRLLDKQIIRTIAEFEDGRSGYEFTSLGRAVASSIKLGLRKVKPDPPSK